MVRILNLIAVLRRRLPRRVGAAIVMVVTVVAAVIVVRAVDGSALADAARQAASEPVAVVVALASFGLAFVLRALAWRRVLPDLSFGHALAGIHVALGANHVLPLRLGEAMRVVSVSRRTAVGVDAAVASTVTLRTADTIALAAWALVVSPAVLVSMVGSPGWLLLGASAVAAVAVAGWLWLRALGRRRPGVQPLGLAALGLSVAAWPAEAVLVHQAAHWAGLEISALEALGVTAVSVLAQIAAIAPGGFGTYEAAGVAAYVAFGYDPAAALVAALTAHALKTAYSVAAGGIGLVAPSPGLVTTRSRSEADGARAGATVQLRPLEEAWQPGTGGPAGIDEPALRQRAVGAGRDLVVLFMPAYNEEASVGDCVRRAPTSVLGCDVEVLVIDDGSTDRTAERAAQAGARVISLPQNRGLGAAVRIGLAAAVEWGAAAVAFCDADGEYAPEELELLVAPVLAGDADYVVGSRFTGEIEVMKPHRRLGNIVLTAALSLVARHRITDGQSGYRAFSRSAAASAEIIHDFNYAQVITLDLLDKGCRYAEVPISYRFRTTGESFIKLGRYLRHVVPAVIRELTTGRHTADTADRANPESVLDKATSY